MQGRLFGELAVEAVLAPGAGSAEPGA
jgi:hypothetical protein